MSRERMVHLGVVILSGTLFAVLAWQLATNAQFNAPLLALSFILGVFAGDLISGFVHLFLDHARAYDNPLFGTTAFEFQIHHIDQLRASRICDIFDELGMTGLLGIPVGILGNFLLYNATQSSWFWASFCLWTILFGMTSQSVHMWAHDPMHAPAFMRVLQRLGLVVTKEYHAVHHRPPFNKRFAIVTGWSNPILDALRVEWVFKRVLSGGKGPVPATIIAEAKKRGVVLTPSQAAYIASEDQNAIIPVD